MACDRVQFSKKPHADNASSGAGIVRNAHFNRKRDSAILPPRRRSKLELNGVCVAVLFAACVLAMDSAAAVLFALLANDRYYAQFEVLSEFVWSVRHRFSFVGQQEEQADIDHAEHKQRRHDMRKHRFLRIHKRQG